MTLKAPMLKVQEVVDDSRTHYKFVGTELELPDHDFDIRLNRADGTSLLIQWRIENETIDICFCKDEYTVDTRAVYVTDATLKNVKRRKDMALVGQQITII